MSQKSVQKKIAPSRKLSLNRETLRTLSGESLEQVAGGCISFTWHCSVEIYCGELH